MMIRPPRHPDDILADMWRICAENTSADHSTVRRNLWRIEELCAEHKRSQRYYTKRKELAE